MSKPKRTRAVRKPAPQPEPAPAPQPEPAGDRPQPDDGLPRPTSADVEWLDNVAAEVRRKRRPLLGTHGDSLEALGAIARWTAARLTHAAAAPSRRHLDWVPGPEDVSAALAELKAACLEGQSMAETWAFRLAMHREPPEAQK